MLLVVDTDDRTVQAILATGVEVGHLKWKTGNPPEVVLVKVNPDYRRQGIGTQLAMAARAAEPALDPGSNILPDGSALLNSLLNP